MLASLYQFFGTRPLRPVGACRGRQAAIMLRNVEQLAATGGWAGLHGFISPLTSFVGREAETTELSLLLAEYRLVTVTGPGGMGKTRLAEVVARRAANAFADGVWMVELARAQEPVLVAPAVMSALGLTDDGNRLPTRALVEALARKQLLLVLDNCEHVLIAAAALCGELLAAADDMRVLATSRAPLGVGGEARYRLKPLRLVTAGGEAAGAEADSVGLFADRARRVDPAFVLDSVSRPQVARIVARLDGVPLAIELAAARVEALGLAQLADGIDDHLPMMASSDLRTAARQRSMAATAKWSYELLDKAERQAFRQLAVFPATFTLEAAEAVAGGAGVRVAVLQLVDWSLLCPPQQCPDGRARYLMLQTLRSYGLERVAARGEYHEVASRLASYSVTMAEQAATGLRSPGSELAAAQQLEAEDATLQQSLAWAQDNEPETALRLAVALAPWWNRQGRRQVGYDHLRRSTEAAVPGDDLWSLAQLRLGQLSPDDYQHASLAHFSAVCDAQAAPPPPPLVLVEALIGRSACLGHLGRYEEARSDGRRARAMAAGLSNADAEAIALISLATIGHYLGDNDYSLACLQDAARIDKSSMSADVALACQHFLARALGESGEFAEARELCAAALVCARETANHAYAAECLATMADLERNLGHLTAARVHLAEAVEAAAGTGNRYRLLECLDVCGHLCAQEGRHAEALTIWAARQACWRDHPLIRLPLEAQRRERLIRDARRALGPDRAAMAEGRGRAMTLAAAAEFALLAAEATASQTSQPGGQLTQSRLSAREQELVRLVAEGRTDAEIARQLTISISTVRSHLDRIRDKTGCRRRADLTRLALQLELI
jgi:predicted ATPase/DNA-binding CsgD family transcriptional regulator